MNFKFFKQKNRLFSLVNFNFYLFVLGLLFFFYSFRILYLFLKENSSENLDSLLAIMLIGGIGFLGFSFDIVEINLDKKTIVKKSFFTLYKQTLNFKNQEVIFFTTRQTIYGIYVGIDIVIEIDYQRIVLKRIYRTKKIDDFIKETQFLIEK